MIVRRFVRKRKNMCEGGATLWLNGREFCLRIQWSAAQRFAKAYRVCRFAHRVAFHPYPCAFAADIAPWYGGIGWMPRVTEAPIIEQETTSGPSGLLLHDP